MPSPVKESRFIADEEAAREGLRWLRSAREDLEYAHHAAGAGFHAPACFHALQAAEKAVKALLFHRDAKAVIGHSVRSLIESLDPPVESLRQLLYVGRDLDLFYIPTRYPNGLDSGTPAEAFSGTQSERAIDGAQRIVGAVGQALGGTGVT